MDNSNYGSIFIGISWLFYWALIDWFTFPSQKAALITGVVFVVVSLLFENRGKFNNHA
jgi:hypothetical protein